MLLNGINHIALISKDIDGLRAFYAEVFDAEVGPTKPHGEDDGETMTMIRIGPHTELNVFTIEGSPNPTDRRRCGDADGSTTSACRRRRPRASRPFGNGSLSTVPAMVRSTISAQRVASSFVIRMGSKAKCSHRTANHHSH